jgi:hypothetical protein
MSDPRDPLNPRNPDPYGRPQSDPIYRERATGPSAMWGWIAGAVVIVLVLAFVFGMQNTSDTASDTTVTPPVTTGQAPAPATTPPATTGQAPSATPPAANPPAQPPPAQQ